MRTGRRSLFTSVIVAACIVGTILSTATAASAQTATKLGRVEIAMWPEYDRPAVLVIYRVSLATDVQLPTTLELKIPAAVGAPTAVAKRVQGRLVNVEHTTKSDADWTTVSLQTDHPELQLEYYASLQTGQNPREFSFQWGGGIEVGQLAYEVQVPAGATEFDVTPAAASKTPGEDGLQYARGSLGAQATDQQATISFSYHKGAGPLTVEWLRKQAAQQHPPVGAPGPVAPPGQAPPAAVPEQAPASGGGTNWILVAILVAAAFAAGIWVAKDRKPDGEGPRRGADDDTRGKRSSSSDDEDGEEPDDDDGDEEEEPEEEDDEEEEPEEDEDDKDD